VEHLHPLAAIYFIVVVFWLSVDILILNYGRIRNSQFASQFPFLKRGLSYFVIPRVSESHVCLSNMLTARKDLAVYTDVLTKGDGLYRDHVVDKMLTSDGSLAGTTLEAPSRFCRVEYLEAKRLENSDKPVRKITGSR
jgi:hypothetical protein